MAIVSSTYALTQNEVIGTLFNQIISQEVFSENIKSPLSMVEDIRVDGSLYGDSKDYISTDALYPEPWVSTGATSLLTETAAPAPVLERIKINKFKQVAVTIYPYMTKRAFMNEGTYGQFVMVVLSWLGDTKRVYEITLTNAFIGTVVSNSTIKEVTVTIPAAAQTPSNEDEEARLKLVALAIGEVVADLFVGLGDVSRDYNENGFLRSYDPKDFFFVWNSAWYNKLQHSALPMVFHKDGVVDLQGIDQRILPARYFGLVSDLATTGATNRALEAMEVGGVKYFAGDLIETGKTVAKNSTYIANADIIARVVHKKAIPFMSAFSVGTSFFDAQKLRENHWLTFGHNKLDYIRNFPIITIKKAV